MPVPEQISEPLAHLSGRPKAANSKSLADLEGFGQRCEQGFGLLEYCKHELTTHTLVYPTGPLTDHLQGYGNHLQMPRQHLLVSRYIGGYISSLPAQTVSWLRTPNNILTHSSKQRKGAKRSK